jgi:hypothetical protein
MSTISQPGQMHTSLDHGLEKELPMTSYQRNGEVARERKRNC